MTSTREALTPPEEYDSAAAAPSRRVVLLGAEQRLGAALVSAFTARGFWVEAPGRGRPPTREDDASVFAIVLIAPVLVCDHGTSRPRRFRAGVDACSGADPREQGRWIQGSQRLGSPATRRGVEAIAHPGTRVAMLHFSLLLDPNPGGALEDLFTPDELPLLLHRQMTILDQPLHQALPRLWSIDTLPSRPGDGWGLGATTALHLTGSGAPYSASWMDEEARSCVDALVALRRTPAGLQSVEVLPF